MARLPDYRAQRGLNTGTAQQLSVDMSGLQRLNEFGRAVEGAGQSVTQIAKRNAQLQRQRDRTEAIEKQQQFNTQMEHALDDVAQAAPANGHGISERFKNDVLYKGASALLDHIPENEQALFQQRLAQDVELFELKAALRERDQGYEYGAKIVETSRAQMLDEIDPVSFEAQQQRYFETLDAAPLPANVRARMVDEGKQISGFKTVRNAMFGDVVTGFESLLG